jgi:hypothetical protein
MAGRDYLKGHASTSKAPGNDTAWSGENAGPYIGVVKNNTDPLRMGRLQVNIPGLSKTTDPISGNLITCEYLSPFYGAKDVRYNLPGSTKYEHSQHSYGFWAVPPDIGTRVLVIFAEGKMDQAFWIGCVQEPMTNHMVPGIAASEKTWDKSSGGAAGQFSSDVDKQSTYGTTVVPAGEVNRSIPGVTATNYNSLNKPIHPLADLLVQQGLSQDDVRGTTTSSARRETPSNVFGISTPGPKDTKTTRQAVGTKDSKTNDFVTRKIGHTFVMDDGDVNGDNQLTRLRTASGHQLLMHDTEGVVYLANGSGKAFIEMAQDGTISVYSDGGINLRSGRDFNLHSDMNINFHAKGTINFTSETNLALNAEGYLFAMGEKGILNSAQKGSVRHFARDGISSYTEGTQLHGAKGRIDLAGKQVHFNSVGASSTWGPGWLKPDAIGIKVTNGLIDIDDDRPFRGPKSSGVDKFGNDIMERGLQVNKIPNKTTVSDFVTHEPYDRQSSTARKKKFIDEAMAEIKASSPELSATELKVIKDELLKQPSIKAVSDKLSKVVNLNDKIKLPITNLNNLVGKATEIQRLIEDPKAAAMNFIYGKIESIKNQALGAVKSFFRF